MRPHGALALARHAPRSGARVLDVDCGRGEITLDLARLVGTKGAVVGIDASEALVARARRDARAVDARNVTFIRGAAESFRFEESESFDLVFARLSPTSLRDAEKALRNIRRALKAGGRLLIVTWRATALNPWLAVASEIVLRHLPPPPAAVGGCRPGLFALADPAMARALLESAGYVAVTLEAIDAPVLLGTTIDEAIALHLEVGTAAELLQDAGDGATAARDPIIADLRGALEPFMTPRGVVMGSSAWCITAANPS